MSKYPKINYIGNKEKLADWIIENLPIKQGTVLDLFCGGCSVSHALKNYGFNVISNDILYSNFVIAKALIENNDETLSRDDFSIDLKDDVQNEKYKKIEFLKETLYFQEEIKELAQLIAISERLDGYKRFLFLALLRRSMIRKIPYSRMNIKWSEIKKLRDETYSYKKYGRYRHYHNIPFIEHIEANLQDYNNALINNKTECMATNYDAIDCLQKLNRKIDLVYLDPPYPSTMNKYIDFYGPFDKMLEKNIEIKTDLTNKETFIENFSKLIGLCVGKTRFVAISLNNNSYPSADLLIQNISCFLEEYVIFERDHVYKITGKENKQNNKELLLICKMKESL